MIAGLISSLLLPFRSMSLNLLHKTASSFKRVATIGYQNVYSNHKIMFESEISSDIESTQSFSSVPANNNTTLPPRLLQIANPIYDYTVRNDGLRRFTMADIGTDHGLLACHLSQYASKVYAVDYSSLALAGCVERVAQFNLYGIVYPVLGKGLQPLLAGRHTVDVLVLAGMGNPLTMTILANDYNILETNYALFKSKFSSNMKALSTKLLVIQTWPSDLFHSLQLYKLILQSDWIMQHQDICQSKRTSFQITTCFEPPSSHAEELIPCSITDAFRSFPLVRNFSCLPSNTKAVFVTYLKKQYLSLQDRTFKGKTMTIEQLKEDEDEDSEAMHLFELMEAVGKFLQEGATAVA